MYTNAMTNDTTKSNHQLRGIHILQCVAFVLCAPKCFFFFCERLETQDKTQNVENDDTNRNKILKQKKKKIAELNKNNKN